MMRIVILALMASLAIAADDEKARPKLSPEVEALVEIARNAAPEIYADAIIKIVESGKVPEKELQVELLESAFQAARSAHEPVRLVAIPQTPLDTRETYRSRAGDLHLDTISLQSRVLKSLLTVDRGKARQIFEGVAHPVLDARPCEDPLVADIAPYYEIAAAIAQSSFSDEEKKHDAHVQFLNALLAGARSPSELAAFANVVDNVTFTHPQWEQIIGAFSAKLASMNADYRSLAVFYNLLEAGVGKLADLARANQVDDRALTGGLHKFLVAQMTAARCSPDIRIEFKEPLTDEETNPASRGADITTHGYFDSGDAKDIGEKLSDFRAKGGTKLLRQPDDNGKYQVVEKIPAPIETENWFGDLLHDVFAWTPQGPEVDAFHQYATILNSLLGMSAHRAEFGKVAEVTITLLTASSAQREAPAEWMYQVKALATAGGAKMLELYRASGNAGLIIYATLWR